MIIMKINHMKIPVLVTVLLFAVVSIAPVQTAQATTSPDAPSNCDDKVKRKVISRPSFYDTNKRKLSGAWVEVSIAGTSRYCIKAWTAGGGKKIVSVVKYSFKRASTSSPWYMTDQTGKNGDFGYYEQRGYTADSKNKSRKYSFAIPYNDKVYIAITPYLNLK